MVLGSPGAFPSQTKKKKLKTSSRKKIFTFSEMEHFSSNVKKKSYILLKESFSYILSKESFSYIFGNGTF